MTGAGRLGDGCGRSRSAGLRAALPGPAAVAVLPPAGSWAPWRLRLPIDCYDLVTGIFVLGAAITWCKLMYDRGVGLGFAEKDQLSALYIRGVGSEGAEDTLECQLGYPQPLLSEYRELLCFYCFTVCAWGWEVVRGEGWWGAGLLGFGDLPS